MLRLTNLPLNIFIRNLYGVFGKFVKSQHIFHKNIRRRNLVNTPDQ